MKKFLYGLLTCMLILPVAFGLVACGNDDDKNVVKIASKNELVAFRDAVNEGTSYADKTVKLTADIDMTGYEWITPIGTGENKFEGTFDGANHTIRALSNSGSASTEQATNATSGLTGGIFGLFGYTKGTVVIKNLKLNVIAEDPDGVMFAGVVACSGYCSGNSEDCNLLIDHVEVSGSLSAKDKVAGFVGEAPYSNAGGATAITNSVNKATVTASGKRAAGFIAGAGLNGSTLNPVGLQNCVNQGNITANSTNGWAAAFVASVNQSGLINAANATPRTASTFVLDNCTNSGTITGSKTGLTYDEGSKYAIINNTSVNIADYHTLEVVAAELTLKYYNNISVDGTKNVANLQNTQTLASISSHFNGAVEAGLITDTMTYKFYTTAADVDADTYACYITVNGGVVAFDTVKHAVASGLLLSVGRTYTIVLTKDCAEDVVALLTEGRYNNGANTYYGSWRSESIKFEVDLNGHDYTAENKAFSYNSVPVFKVLVATEAQFLQAFGVDSSVTLGADITLANKIDINKDFEIDLNFHTITFAGANAYLVSVAANRAVTIKNGTIRHTSAVLQTGIVSYINNRGTLTLKNINLQIDNVDAAVNMDQNVNAVGNNGEGNITVDSCVVSITTVAEPTCNFKPVGIWNLGRTFTVTDSIVNVVSHSTGSTYGAYCYIDDDEVDPGTRTLNISGTTINVTSTVLNTSCAVFAESYVAGDENKAIINIGANTVVNVTRDSEPGNPDVKTYGLRAKTNAVVNGANNVTITLNDTTGCALLETAEQNSGVIND